MRINNWFRYHSPVVFFCLLIFIISSIPGNKIPDPGIDFSDKLAHAIVYGVLFILFFYSLNNQNKSAILKTCSMGFALLFTVLYGISDEIHQMFTPGRKPDIWDVVANSIGAFIAYIILKINRNRLKFFFNSIFILTLTFLSGCSGSKTTQDRLSGLSVSLGSYESWYDLMPVVGEKNEIFRFTLVLDLSVSGRASSFVDMNKFSVRDLNINFPGVEVEGKLFDTRLERVDASRSQLLIFHDLNEIYSPDKETMFESVNFSFDVYYDNKFIKSFKTPNTQINKVY